jgi:hypothetical protein
MISDPCKVKVVLLFYFLSVGKGVCGAARFSFVLADSMHQYHCVGDARG